MLLHNNESKELQNIVKQSEIGVPQVSVIVPAYNAEKYIKKCLDSLTGQTLKGIEIIVVDDGSTDRTLEIVRELASKDTRITVITQSNQKQGAARNRGLEIAKGEYIGFVDADDWVDLDYYEKLYNAAKKYNSDIALADYIRIGNGKTKKRLNIKQQTIQSDIKGKIKICKQFKHPCPTNKIYRAKMLRQEGITFPEGVYCEDKIFTLKAVYYANAVISVPKTYYYYFRNPVSTVHVKDRKHDLDKNNAKLEVEKFLKEKGIQNKNPLLKLLDYLKTFPHRRIENNYNKKIKELRNAVGKRKIRVIFYVTENQKWAYQSLYEEFAKDERFYPLVLISILTAVHKGRDKTRLNSEENYEFFKSRNMNVEYLYKNGKYTNLKDFKPDIVFYEQPWGLPSKYKPKNVSKYALCCYVPYSIAHNPKAMQKVNTFYETIWKYFIAHECLINELTTTIPNNKASFCVTGHPKLDAYASDTNIENKHYIIYAPHFSVKKSLLSFGTFDWSGKYMLEYAQAHPEFNWVFKPHPNLVSSFIKTGYMSEDEIKAYFDEWAKVGLVYTQGDYLDIFKASDAMITDCGSFLVEYFITGKPLLHLVSKDSAPHSELNRLVSNNYYKIYNKESLDAYLNEILVKKNDFLVNTRIKQKDKLFNNNFNSAKKILICLKQELKLEI